MPSHNYPIPVDEHVGWVLTDYETMLRYYNHPDADVEIRLYDGGLLDCVSTTDDGEYYRGYMTVVPSTARALRDFIERVQELPDETFVDDFSISDEFGQHFECYLDDGTVTFYRYFGKPALGETHCLDLTSEYLKLDETAQELFVHAVDNLETDQEQWCTSITDYVAPYPEHPAVELRAGVSEEDVEG